LGLGLCGGCTDQDGRRADEINEHQRYPRDATGNDIVAFSHFRSPVLQPKLPKLSHSNLRDLLCVPPHTKIIALHYHRVVECYGEAQGRSSYTVCRDKVKKGSRITAVFMTIVHRAIYAANERIKSAENVTWQAAMSNLASQTKSFR
jgi:hypothetical protein